MAAVGVRGDAKRTAANTLPMIVFFMALLLKTFLQLPAW